MQRERKRVLGSTNAVSTARCYTWKVGTLYVAVRGQPVADVHCSYDVCHWPNLAVELRQSYRGTLPLATRKSAGVGAD